MWVDFPFSSLIFPLDNADSIDIVVNQLLMRFLP